MALKYIMLSGWDISMSISDASLTAVKHDMSSRSPQAPGGRSHSLCGAFQLMHLGLFEANEGSTRRAHFFGNTP